MSTSPMKTTRAILLGLLFCGFSMSIQAQVTLTIDGENVTITNEDGSTQFFVNVGALGGGQSGSEGATGWIATDAEGNEYPAGSFLGRTTGGTAGGREETVILTSGYEGRTTGGTAGGREETVILTSGYEEVLNILINNYGAVIEHDAELNVDVLTFPNADDPIYTFLIAILTETYEGRPLIDYLALIELPTVGTFDAPAYRPIKVPSPHRFPDDTYYKSDWGLQRTLFDRLAWHTALAKKQVKVSVIDSGVRAPFQGHEGLDGANIQHIEVAPSFDQNLPHALGLLTLLGDRGHDGSGSAGLMGSWTTGGCNVQPALMAQVAPQILSYNAGDVAPSSYYVSRAIRESIAAGVDVINLSLRLPYSVTVEEAIQAALDAGIIVVAAGGNYTNGGSLNATFPASMAGVIAVGAGKSNRKFTSISAQNGIDIVAPGENVVVGRTDGEWQYASGTSFAAAYVTATAAYMRAVNPNVTTTDVVAAMQATADQKNKTNGIGFLNAFEAVNAVLPAEEQASLNDVVQPHGCALNDDDVIRINAGGGLVDHQGHGWSTDHRFQGGGTRNSKNSAVEPLFQTERRGRSFSYDIALPNDQMYDVALTFVELAHQEAGKRLFDVDVEQQQGVLTDFDIFAEAGALTPLEKTFHNISVQDGRLTLTFTASQDNAQVSAIAITSLGRPANNRPVLAAIPETMVGETLSQSVTLSATDADGDALTFSAIDLPGFAALAGNTLTFSPQHGDAGVYTFPVRVDDAYNHDTQDVTVIVTPDDTNLLMRLNAGGSEVTVNGVTWSEDAYFSTNQATGRTRDISETAYPDVYQRVRFGSTWYYDIPVPEPAKYTVKLHFAELWHDAGKRIFHVDLEDNRVLENFDIAAEVGRETALVKTFEGVAVVDGELSIDFSSVSDRAMVSAIEIFKTGETLTVDDPFAGLTPLYRFNAGGDPVTTSGTDWTSDTYFFNTNSQAGRTGNVRGTVDDALFTQVRFGSTWYYDIPVPEAATYTVRLGFAELWHNPGKRIFHVDLEDQRVLENFDVAAEVGSWRPLVKTFENVPVVDGELSLDFTSVSDRAMVSFIEVYATGEVLHVADADAGLTPVLKINAGSEEALTLTDGTWEADQFFFNTGRTSFKDGNVRGTVDDALYLSHRYSNDFYYEVPVAPGEYTVRLYFMERSFSAAGKRIFNVDVEDGAAGVDNLDVFAEVGSWRTLVKTFDNVVVTDGELSLDFSSVTNNAIVSGIAIYSNGVNLAFTDPLDGLTPLVRLNAGGEAVNVGGIDWSADAHFGGSSKASSRAGNVRGTTDDVLLTTVRSAKDFYYDVPVPEPGKYTVRLHFAELWQSQAGKRVFSVDVEEGQAGIENLDLVQEVGAWRPLVQTFENIEVLDGELSLDFLASTNHALISGIEVFATGETIPVVDPLASLTPVAFINAGGDALTTSNGAAWTPDAHFGGSSKTSSNTKNPIRGTVDDLLYQTERWDKDFYYDIPVPNNAVYSVRLHFTETSKSAAGQRIFGISVEDGQASVDDLDIFARAGRYRPMTLTFNDITVRDGELSLDFLASKDRAKVSAIEVFATGTTVDDPEAERFAGYTPVAFLNAGGEALDATSWTADAFFGSSKTTGRSNSIRGTMNDALYQRVRFNSTFFYDIAVPSAGMYAVRLHFAELWHSAEGKRIFNVNVEDQALLENLDLAATVGKDRALVQTFENIVVADGELSLDFTSVKDKAMVAGIEIYLMEADSAPDTGDGATPIVRLNAGSESLDAWSEDQFFAGKSKTYTKAKDIRSTPNDALYHSERYGKTFSYDIPVNGEGPYLVKLHFAEVYFKDAGKRVFSVDVENGQGTLNDFDIVAEAGAQRAVVKTFDHIVVTDSVLTLAFAASTNNAKVSAIEVFAVGDGALGDVTLAAGKMGVVLDGLAEQAPEVPTEFTLDQNYPNPFNPTTTIAFALPEARNVSLRVYDMLGREVAVLVDRSLEAGQHKIQWDASDLASGTYLYRIVAGNYISVKTMVLVK